MDDLTMNTERVEELIRARGWSWGKLADQMGMDKSTVYRVVQGKTRPGRKFIFALLEVFPGERELFAPVAQPKAAA